MVLAIDVGTTNSKTLLLDCRGRILAKRIIDYPFSIPEVGWAEQDPEIWWAAVKSSIQHLVADRQKNDIRAIGLSGQMHGLVALDKDRKVLRPAMLWNDQRAGRHCQDIYRLVGGREKLLSLTNNPMLPGYTGGKILWLRDNEPAVFAKIDKVLLPKDFIRYKLTETLGTDFSDASGTGLFDVRHRAWSGELLSILGIPAEWLVSCCQATEVVGTVSRLAAQDLGLSENTRVIAGGGDAVVQTIGAGAAAEDEMLAVIGTGGNITLSMPVCPRNPDSTTQVFCHVLPEKWVAMGVTLNAGNSLKWFLEALGAEEKAQAMAAAGNAFELLAREAEKSSPSAGGLFFLPYLQGERSPHTDPHARGCFIGLNLRSGKADIVRSIMEGVVFSLYDVFLHIGSREKGQRKVILSGGGAESRLWRKIMADVFAAEVVTRDNSQDASALGAGLLAGVGVGLWKDVSEAAEGIKACGKEMPDLETTAVYAKAFDIYRELYARLAPAFRHIATLDRGKIRGDRCASGA
ncbi:MAG: xylulokinase [Spirochaetes bacterium RBG_16_67_19]|nr:MAG: xylulokinase [Spirochaetes bacterium RBG_16_67_19]